MSKQWQRDRLVTGADPLPGECLVCEAMCPDAVDGTLTEAEQRAFDKHVAGCVHCARELEEAQRGAAWLGLLKSQASDPPATLLVRILAETTGSAEQQGAAQLSAGAPASQIKLPAATPNANPRPVLVPATVVASPYGMPSQDAEAMLEDAGRGRNGKLLAFRRRLADWNQETAGPALHPRLAMTAAMAFFSIALTLNLTGVHLRDVRLSNLEPAKLERTAATAQASAVRSFQNLRVVYQVESRVSELRRDPVWEGRFSSGLSGRAADSDRKDKANSSRGQD